jgi:hypothetical protein
MRHGRPVAFAIILALLVAACGREQTSGTSPLFPAPLGTAWGFIDSRGKTVIAPRFEAALPFLKISRPSNAGGDGAISIATDRKSFPFATARPKVSGMAWPSWIPVCPIILWV